MPVALWQSCTAMWPCEIVYRSPLTCPKRPRAGRSFSSTHSHPNQNTDRARRVYFSPNWRALLRNPNPWGSDGIPCRKDSVLARITGRPLATVPLARIGSSFRFGPYVTLWADPERANPRSRSSRLADNQPRDECRWYQEPLHFRSLALLRWPINP